MVHSSMRILVLSVCLLHASLALRVPNSTQHHKVNGTHSAKANASHQLVAHHSAKNTTKVGTSHQAATATATTKVLKKEEAVVAHKKDPREHVPSTPTKLVSKKPVSSDSTKTKPVKKITHLKHPKSAPVAPAAKLVAHNSNSSHATKKVVNASQHHLSSKRAVKAKVNVSQHHGHVNASVKAAAAVHSSKNATKVNETVVPELKKKHDPHSKDFIKDDGAPHAEVAKKVKKQADVSPKDFGTGAGAGDKKAAGAGDKKAAAAEKDEDAKEKDDERAEEETKEAETKFMAQEKSRDQAELKIRIEQKKVEGNQEHSFLIFDGRD